MKFGIIVSKGSARKTLPLIEAVNEYHARIVAGAMAPDWEVTTVEVEPFWWNNCLYGGNAVGHSHGFCTADSCY